MSNPLLNNTEPSQDDKEIPDAPIIIGFLYGIQSDFLSTEEVEHRVAGFRHTKGYKEALHLITQKQLEARLDEWGNHVAIDGQWSKEVAEKRIAELSAELTTQKGK